MSALLVLATLEVAIGIGCFVGAGRNLRRFALLLLTVTAPLEVYRTGVAGVNPSLFRLSLAIALVIVLRSPESRQVLRRVNRIPIFLTYGALAVIMLVSLATMSDNVALGARVFAQVTIGIIAAALVYALASQEPLMRIARYILVGASVPLAAAAWQLIVPSEPLPLLSLLPVPEGLEVTRDPLPVFEATARARGTFGDPSHFGAYLLLVGAVALASTIVAFRQWATRRTASLSVLLACILGVVFATYSRSAWLGCVAAISLVTVGAWLRLAADPARTTRAAVVPLAVACCFIAATAPLASAVNDRLDPSSAGNVVSNSVHERTVTVALDDLLSHPLTGIGIADLGPQLEQAVRSSGAHSSYLTVAAEIGAPGLVLMLLAPLLTLRLLHRGMSASAEPDRLMLRSIAAGYIGFAIANLSYDLWWDDFHWVVLGLVIASCAEHAADDLPALRDYRVRLLNLLEARRAA